MGFREGGVGPRKMFQEIGKNRGDHPMSDESEEGESTRPRKEKKNPTLVPRSSKEGGEVEPGIRSATQNSPKEKVECG